MQVTMTSTFTGVRHTMELDITLDHLLDWQGGMLIQEAMPHLSPSEREFLMTGASAAEMLKYLRSIFKRKSKPPKYNSVSVLQHVEIGRPDGTVLHIFRRL